MQCYFLLNILIQKAGPTFFKVFILLFYSEVLMINKKVKRLFSYIRERGLSIDVQTGIGECGLIQD